MLYPLVFYTMKKENDSFLQIDSARLDQEWQDQPSLYHEWATKLADAKQDYDDVVNEKEVLYSDLYLKVTQDPTAYGLPEKTTVASIEAAIKSNQKYQAVCREEIDAKHTIGLVDAAVKALDHRKRALEKIVELHLSDYYSPPRISDEKEKRLLRRGKKKPQ